MLATSDGTEHEIGARTATPSSRNQPMTFQYRPISAPRDKVDSRRTSPNRMPESHQRHSTALNAA